MSLVEKAKAFVKKHPYMTGALVLGIGFLLYMLSSGGAGGGGGGSDAAAQEQADQLEAALAGQQAQEQAAQYQSDAQLAADQLSAQVQENAQNTQLQTAGLAASLQQAEAELAAETQDTSTAAQVTENSQNTSAETQLGLYSVLGGVGTALLSNIKSIGQLFTGTPASVTITGGSSGLFGSTPSTTGGLNLSNVLGSGSTATSNVATDIGGTPLSESFGDLPGADIGSISGFGSDANILPSFTDLGSQVSDLGDVSDLSDIGDFA